MQVVGTRVFIPRCRSENILNLERGQNEPYFPTKRTGSTGGCGDSLNGVQCSTVAELTELNILAPHRVDVDPLLALFSPSEADGPVLSKPICACYDVGWLRTRLGE